jgi:hypothetical protein
VETVVHNLNKIICLLILSALTSCESKVCCDACSLDKPPKEAARHPTHGVDFLVYPNEVPKRFTGCQKVWLEDGSLLSSLKYTNGIVTSVELTEPEQQKVICKFSDKKLLEGPSDVCLPYEKWVLKK